ncbi:metal-dependent transcriptional regulator [Planctomycetota bacterium]
MNMMAAKKAKLSASLEDYLEAIYNLAGESGSARSTDIAKLLGVSKASVTGALRTLSEKGLVNYHPYGDITLSTAGISAATEVAQKHKILKSFFIDVLGITPQIAQQSACKAEHALGRKVIAQLLSFIEFVKANHKNGSDVKTEFAKFCQQASKTKSKKTSRKSVRKS